VIDESLSRTMAAVRELVSLGLQVRTAQKLRVRQPLAAAEIVLTDPAIAAALEPHVALIAEELNVRSVHFVAKADEYVRWLVKPNFRALGPRVGKHMPAVKAHLAAADGARLLHELETTGHVELVVGDERFELGPEEIAVTLEAKPGFVAASGNAGVVVLHTTLTPELVDEGLFREVLSRVQGLRKELDLEYTVRIQLVLSGAPRLLEIVRARVDVLARETLATIVGIDEPVRAGAREHRVEIDGETLVVGLRLADG
jgi:isoleucyl-tRNA synthetase